jgi:hypothetical protein
MVTVITKAKVFDEEDEMYQKLCTLHTLPYEELQNLSRYFKNKKKKKD